MALFLMQIQHSECFVLPLRINDWPMGDSSGKLICQGDGMPACIPKCLSLAMLQLIPFLVSLKSKLATAEKRITSDSTKATYKILEALEQCLRHD